MAFPSDPADLFAHLIGRADFSDFDGLEGLIWMADEQVRDIASFIEETALNRIEGLSPESIQEILEAADDSEDYARRTFTVLLGIDRALMYVNPFYGSIDQGALVRIAVRYGKTGVLNSNTTEGRLLPRAAFPGRPRHTPNTLNDAFASVVWVPPQEWNRVNHKRLRSVNDLTRVDREEGFKVACVPILTDPSELDWDVVDRDIARFFRIRPNRSCEARGRVEQLLAELDLSGATVAVLPELSLDDDMLHQWKTALVEHEAVPAESKLKWIVLGSGDVGGDNQEERPLNRCVVLDRVTGEEILTQDKIYPFTLEPDQLSEWQIERFLGSTTIEEDMEPGDRVCLAESHLGRVAVLICEDLARIMDLGPPLRSNGVSHVFSPVFSKETHPHHWEHQKAKEYANEVGAVVVVANSLVVARLMNPEGPWRTALVHSPLTTQLRTTEQWKDIAEFEIKSGDPLPILGSDKQFERADDDFTESLD